MLTHDTPNKVARNHVAQVKRQPRISWTELRECVPYFCAKQNSLRKGYVQTQRVCSLIWAKATAYAKARIFSSLFYPIPFSPCSPFYICFSLFNHIVWFTAQKYRKKENRHLHSIACNYMVQFQKNPLHRNGMASIAKTK